MTAGAAVLADRCRGSRTAVTSTVSVDADEGVGRVVSAAACGEREYEPRPHDRSVETSARLWACPCGRGSSDGRRSRRRAGVDEYRDQLNQGVSLLASGDFSGAIDSLEAPPRAKPEHGQALILLGEARLATRDPGKRRTMRSSGR